MVRLRDFFHARNFWEVETPILARETIVDRYLDPIHASDPLKRQPHVSDQHRSDGCWLQTSPELHMKQLMASGADAIFQVTRAFRADELSPRHNPEFTLVEWYRRNDTLETGMQLLAELCDHLLPFGAPKKLSYQQAFLDTLAIDPFVATAGQLRDVAREREIAAPASFQADGDVDAWLNLLMSEVIEPALANSDRPTILYDYPSTQAALAKLRAAPQAGHPTLQVAERFELYAGGIELANGYHELQDADELEARQRLANVQRAADGRPPLPGPAGLIKAMRSGLPNCVGVALGFDRLAMLSLDVDHIRDVVAFPFSH